jgi:uncharacterized membrane protein
MLFVIPGIIKSLQYCMVPFLLSDNPHMSGSRARQLSRMMTDGEKGAIFVLYLSFIGWFFLAGLGDCWHSSMFISRSTRLPLF